MTEVAENKGMWSIALNVILALLSKAKGFTATALAFLIVLMLACFMGYRWVDAQARVQIDRVTALEMSTTRMLAGQQNITSQLTVVVEAVKDLKKSVERTEDRVWKLAERTRHRDRDSTKPEEGEEL